MTGMQNLTPVRFNWDTQSDQSKTWSAYTDGTTWNGWPNLWVPHKDFLEMMDYLDADADGDPDQLESLREMRALPVDGDGLVGIGWGYTPTIVAE